MDNFSYIIADEVSKEAAVVDSSYNEAAIERLLLEQGFKLRYLINTHEHSDHTAGNLKLRQKFHAKVVAHRESTRSHDIEVDDGSILTVGSIPMKFLHTPGHSPDSICVVVDRQKLLTGDTLFVGECGRTDMPGGNAGDLYDSLFNKLMKLDSGIEVYPGHDYGSSASSTIDRERRTNYVLKPRSKAEFVEFMTQP